MSTTSGKSFKQISDLTGTTLTYGFEVLSSDDIVVVGINTTPDPDVRTTLVKDTHYTLNTTTKTLTSIGGTWAALSADYNLIRAYRVTTAAALVDFKSGGVLSESDLDTAYKQALFVAQEVSEDAAGTGASGLQSVGEAALEAGAVTEGKIGANAVTATKIADDAVVAAKIADDAVTAAKVADNAVLTAAILNDAVVTDKIADDAVTFEKLADVLDSDTMSGASATKVATSESIKAYTDARAGDPARVYNSLVHSTVSATVIQNTTGRPLWTSFTLLTTDNLDYLILEISPNADMSSLTRIGQIRIEADGNIDSGGQVTGIVPAGWYWKYTYSGSATITEKIHSSFTL